MATSYNEDFYVDRELIDPNEVTMVDLILLLFNSDIKKRRFIDCPDEDRTRNFQRRWLIFVSSLVQKCLISSRRTLAQVGDGVEMWLNLVSSNGGFFKLLVNFFKGNMVKPDRNSATFRSVIANTDPRMELDEHLRPGHKKYNASLSLMAAKLSYENEASIKSIVKDHWNMEFLGFYNFWNEYQGKDSTKLFMLQDTKDNPNLILVAFRGTNPFDADDWCTDVDISWYEIKGIGKIHRGFMKALGLQKDGWPKQIDQGGDHLYAYYAIRERVTELLQKNEKAKFILAGHSLGGALAILFVFVLAFHEEDWLLKRLEGVYTFGQPRVGDGQFGQFMEEKLREFKVRYSRFVYCNDMVPRLPFDDQTLLYKHFGLCLYYNSGYKGQVTREEPNKNYFNLFWAIPKNFNAVWELVRSFILPFIKGPDYKETWFMRMFRLIGLVIPGLSAHCPQDYDNLSRLGSLRLSLQLEDPLQELHQD